MQEDQTVSFQPMFDVYPHSWYMNLFVLYMLFVLILLLIRAAQIGSALRKLRKLQKSTDGVSVTADAHWTSCVFKIQSLKSFAKLTFLLSILTFTLNLSKILLGLQAQRTVRFAFILPLIGGLLSPFTAGLILCILLFACAMLAESALERRRPVLTLEDRLSGNKAATDH